MLGEGCWGTYRRTYHTISKPFSNSEVGSRCNSCIQSMTQGAGPEYAWWRMLRYLSKDLLHHWQANAFACQQCVSPLVCTSIKEIYPSRQELQYTTRSTGATTHDRNHIHTWTTIHDKKYRSYDTQQELHRVITHRNYNYNTRHEVQELRHTTGITYTQEL
jgi:hypothetical protein